MTDSEFNRLIEAQKREGVPTDVPSSSAELDTRRSKSALGPSALGAGSDEVVIGYDEANQAPIYGHAEVATPHESQVAGAGGGSDIIYGDADEGVIAGGGRFQPAPAVAQAPAQDIVFGDEDEGGTPVDLSAHRGESSFRLDATEPTEQETLANQRPDDA